MKQALLPRLARLALALSAGLTSLAHAGLVSYTSQVSYFSKENSYSDRLQYQRFDADLGLLREVRFTYDFSLRHTLVYSNLGDQDLRLGVRYGGTADGSSPGNWYLSKEQWEFLDVAANTRQASVERSWSGQRSFSITQDLAAFIGDTPGWMDYHLRFFASGYHDPGSPLGFGSMTTSRLSLRVDYLYDLPPAPEPAKALPEPASLALVAGACAAAMATRRRRTLPATR